VHADWITLLLDYTIPAIPDFSWSHATGALPPLACCGGFPEIAFASVDVQILVELGADIEQTQTVGLHPQMA
jgi:hypothetical protein